MFGFCTVHKGRGETDLGAFNCFHAAGNGYPNLLFFNGFNPKITQIET